MLLTILIVIGYFGGILTLFFLRILDQKDLISNVTIAFGWIVAFLIAYIHLKKARKDNEELKREEIRRKLEIEAFHEMNKALDEYAGRITKLSVFFLWFPRKFKSHLENPLIFKFDLKETIQEIMKLDVDVLFGKTHFVLTYEANEIIFLEFDHFRKFFIMQTDDLHKMVEKFENYFVNENKDQLRDEEKFKLFKNKCNEIWSFSSDIVTYLSDLRVLLINSKLGEIFDSLVPMREPLDSKYKLLTEIATKEIVEKQAEERIREELGHSEQLQE